MFSVRRKKSKGNLFITPFISFTQSGKVSVNLGTAKKGSPAQILGSEEVIHRVDHEKLGWGEINLCKIMEFGSEKYNQRAWVPSLQEKAYG